MLLSLFQSFDELIVVILLVDCFFVAPMTFAVALDELNGFIYYCEKVNFIIRRATFKGEHITDILNLGPGSTFPGYTPGRVCNILLMLVLGQCRNAYCQLFVSHLLITVNKIFVKWWLDFLMLRSGNGITITGLSYTQSSYKFKAR